MIPTMILWGLVVGRWPRWAILAAPLIWLVVLWFDPIVRTFMDFGNVLTSGGLAAVNAAVGVAVHQGVLYLVRRFRNRGNTAGDDDAET